MFVIVVMAVFGIHQCEEKRDYKDKSENKDVTIEQKEAKLRHYIDVDSRRIDSVRTVRQEDSLKVSKQLSALNQSVSFWKRKASEVRPQIQQIADTSAIVRQYVEATDSVISRQDSVISVQRGHEMVQSKLWQFEVAKMGEKYVKQQELTEVWKDEAYRQERNFNRSERKKRFWRSVSIGLAGACVVLGLAAH